MNGIKKCNMKCPNCGAQINDDSLFCTECGKPIPQCNVCSHCGATVNEGDTFCQNCGRKVDYNLSKEELETMQKKCPYCRELVNEGDVFCESCGRNLADGSMRGAYNENEQEQYVMEGGSSRKSLSIIASILAIVLICGGLWYWYSIKKDEQTQTTSTIIPQSNSNIIAVDSFIRDSDFIEETVDSVIDEVYDEYEIDTVMSDNNEIDKIYNEVEDKDSRCWFVYGTIKELEEHRVINGNSILNTKLLNKDYFTEIGHEEKEIKLYSKNVEVLSQHPSDSYELRLEDNGNYKLCIIDPSRFWNNTKYLVIIVK